MNTFTYMGRWMGGWMMAVAIFAALPALGSERKLPEITLKKSSNCDLELSRYASEGHGGKRAFIAREVKKKFVALRAVSKAPVKAQARTSARGGLTFTASVK